MSETKTPNKTLNTAFFLILSTVFMICFTILTSAVLLMIILIIFKTPDGQISEKGQVVTGLIVPLIPLIGSFLLYSKLVKKITTRYDMQKYLHPIFKSWDKKKSA